MISIVADLHTHTNVSQHAFSSLEEMLAGAKRAGHMAIAITNHCPSMEDGAHQWHFGGYRSFPKVFDGVYLIPGVEYDIFSNGDIYPFERRYFDIIQFSIASFHEPVFPPETLEKHTAALEKILKNPCIDVLGHLGNPHFPFDEEYIISKCNEYGKMVEINANSFRARVGSSENCHEIALLCKKHGVTITVNSDAHISYNVGNVTNALQTLADIDFPEELILNADKDRLRDYFLKRKGFDILNPV